MVSLPRSELLSKLEETRQELIDQLQGVSEEMAARFPQEGEWSIKQNLAHVPMVERLFRGMAQRMRDEDYPNLDVPPGEGVEEELARANQRSLEDLLLEMSQARQETLDFMKGLSDEELLGKKGCHTEWGEMTILQMLRTIYRHDRMHVEQVAKTRDLVSS